MWLCLKLCEYRKDLFDVLISVLQREIKPPVVIPGALPGGVISRDNAYLQQTLQAAAKKCSKWMGHI